jgi:hypothetical protein
MPGEELNVSEDWVIVRGSTATYKFRMIPFNAVGASAVMLIPGAPFGPFTMVLDNEFMGSVAYVDVSVTVSAATTAGYAVGVYGPYQILITLASGSVQPVGTGSEVVK